MPEPATLNPKLETTPPSDPSHQCAIGLVVVLLLLLVVVVVVIVIVCGY